MKELKPQIQTATVRMEYGKNLKKDIKFDKKNDKNKRGNTLNLQLKGIKNEMKELKGQIQTSTLRM